jgi:hypothetical protein
MDMRGSGLESPLDGSRVPVPPVPPEPPEHRRCSAHDAQTSLVYNDYNIMTIYIYMTYICIYIYYYNIITMFILMILMFHNVLQFYIDSTVLQICSTMLYSNESTNQNNLMAMTRDLAFECF